MEENKVASNSDLRERAFKTYRKLREIALNPAGVHVDSVEAIFRELVAVRDQAAKFTTAEEWKRMHEEITK